MEYILSYNYCSYDEQGYPGENVVRPRHRWGADKAIHRGPLAGPKTSPNGFISDILVV